MGKTTVEKLGEFGQSIWLDNISRSMIESGSLKEMIGMGLRGMTSNPTIFDKAIRFSKDYDTRIEGLANLGKSTFEIYDDLTVKDVQDAADIFKPLYDKTDKLDGYVSLEVSPKLAFNIDATIQEARRLFREVNRANVMFKVPATDAGYRAVEELLAEGININATLIFSLEQYSKTAQAFLKGMDMLQKKGKGLKEVHSVASVFVSRVDTIVDTLIDKRIAEEKDRSRKAKLESLKGKAAIANSRRIFQKYIELFSGDAFKKLEKKGCNVQRVLWASTSTKNPTYSDIKYVTGLIGKGSVNTLPDETFRAFLDHGFVEESIVSDSDGVSDIISSLRDFGIDIDIVCSDLLHNGVVLFEKSFDTLLVSIESKKKSLCSNR